MKMIFCSHANKLIFTRIFSVQFYIRVTVILKTVKFCENNAKKRQLLTNNTIVICCEKKMARIWSSMTRQLFDANDAHQLLKRAVVVLYY